MNDNQLDGCHIQEQPSGLLVATPKVHIGGVYDIICRNRDGSIAWQEIFHNGVTNVFLNHMLGATLDAEAQITTWYLGLVDNASFSAFAAGDTMSSHAGWIEMVAYSESVRQTWNPTVASQSAANASRAVFTANATKTVKGAFLTSSSTKSGTTGTLGPTGAFPSTHDVVNGQTLEIIYTISAA